MLITSMNKEAWGDTLIVVLAQDSAVETTTQKGDIVGIFDEAGAALGFNFFNVSQWLPALTGDGQVHLSEADVATLNQALEAAGFEGVLPVNEAPTLVIGKIVAIEAHPDADHLHITQVDLGNGNVRQIVCGAPNAALNETVVAALPGTMMPDGKIIWPGKLRGVDSYGMLCAARELAVPGAPAARGILLMPANIPAGTPYDPIIAAEVVAAAN
ncbi:YtpR family tRNA-binding protein [Lacticaseibacillus mingshuiensis]|uniref:YtpR family tRNA-binding protein n=1 Tax=Lacticaseibacillus mingshuiensis TaxID=2799574 RepID=A0ABW4CI85_9LACO|nr:DUF4479 and tRNA-binding domain-containing protein [Lacticaseibacillus mingshuiensis]